MERSSPVTVLPGRERPALVAAWREYLENVAHADAVARICAERARASGDTTLLGRAGALIAAVALHRGDVGTATAAHGEAVAAVTEGADLRTDADLAAVSAQLGFHLGDYARAVRDAQRAITLADASEDLALRIRARRATCIVYGNLRTGDTRRLVDELLELATVTDEPWEQAISRNDLACVLFEDGDLDRAEAETARALRLLGPTGHGNDFATAVILTTRADIRLAAGRPGDGLADAETAIGLLLAAGEPDPYIFAAAVRAQMEALNVLGREPDARRAGLAALADIGDRVPHTRARLLVQLAEALAQQGFEAEADAARETAEALSRVAEMGTHSPG